MKLQLLICIALVALIVVFVASYLKEFLVKTEGFDEELPTCTYTALAIPNAYIQNCSGTEEPFICMGYTSLNEAQTACNSILGCKGITYRLDTVMGQHYTLRSGYVADPKAPVATTVTSFSGESSYVITNLAVCKPNWQEGAPWQSPVIQKTIARAAGAAGATGAGSAANAISAKSSYIPAVDSGVGAAIAKSSDIFAVDSGVGAGAGVTIPGGTMVLTSAMNTIWANSMASQPAPLKGGAGVIVAGPGAGAGTTATTPTAATTDGV
jgi:hypothetical protein